MVKRVRFKRAFDVMVSLALIPVALPLTIVALIAIRLESPGSPLFVQTRVGRHRKPFRLYKLRTMARATKDLPSHSVDPIQITRVGRFMRRTKLDELPQLLNVLGGTMSLVGPRPCLPSQIELISERHARGLYEVRPGITGAAQIVGIDMSKPELLARTEAEYYPCATLTSDLAILVRTFVGAGRGDAALRQDR